MDRATTSLDPIAAAQLASVIDTAASTVSGSCTCQPGRGWRSGYSRAATYRQGDPRPNAAALVAVVPTSSPMMTFAGARAVLVMT
jgi:hypothetical protein